MYSNFSQVNIVTGGDIAEQIAATYADIVYLGVGLHSGYGNAQRMYGKRGYVPDGSGVCSVSLTYKYQRNRFRWYSQKNGMVYQI